VTRIEQGNFGDHKFCRDGVWELRIDVGAGYRVYYAMAGQRVVLLLCGGDKRTQERISMKSRAHDEAMAELYRKDPEFALQVINNIFEDGNQGELLIVLRQMAKAFGGVQTVAEKAHLSTTQLYRTLSPEGNPVLSSLSAILKAMGLRLAVQAVQTPHAHV
jgi:probable addiction module antidote protein